MSVLKIRGSGDVRTVWSDEGQIGTIHRRERRAVHMSKGPTSATLRAVTEVSWWACWMTGEPVRWHDTASGPGKRKVFSTMKSWADRAVWGEEPQRAQQA